MIKDITIGQYVPGDSFIHKLDPRTKILISILFIVDIFLIKSFWGYLFVVLFIGAILYVSKLSPKYLFKGLKAIFVLVLITAILNVFMIKGETLIYKWGFLEVYREGLRTAGFMILRLIFLISGTSLLTLTTSPIELTDGIEKLLNPFKKIGLPAHELAMMMT